MKYIFAFILIFSSSCKRNPRAEAVSMKSCSTLFGCSGNNVCLAGVNICVSPCKIDSDCPNGFLCKGYFKDIRTFSGLGNKFCRKAVTPEGGNCSSIKTACQKGLACVDNICRKICTSDEECNKNKRCIMDVLSSVNFSPDSSYRVCAIASLKKDAPCKEGKEPFCSEGNVCLDGKCRLLCETDEDCSKNEKCKGRGYSGWKGKLRYVKGEKGDLKYCVSLTEK